jgi:hypothetical protein
MLNADTNQLSGDKQPLTIAGIPVIAKGCPMPYVRLKQPTPRLNAIVVKSDMSARPLKSMVHALELFIMRTPRH